MSQQNRVHHETLGYITAHWVMSHPTRLHYRTLGYIPAHCDIPVHCHSTAHCDIPAHSDIRHTVTAQHIVTSWLTVTARHTVLSWHTVTPHPGTGGKRRQKDQPSLKRGGGEWTQGAGTVCSFIKSFDFLKHDYKNTSFPCNTVFVDVPWPQSGNKTLEYTWRVGTTVCLQQPPHREKQWQKQTRLF